MREVEASLQQFGEYLLKAQLVREKAAPYFVRWVRRFLSGPATDEPLEDQVRRFSEGLERSGRCEDWQVRQAEQALRIYFVHFLNRADWHRRPVSDVLDEQGRADPLAALQRLRDYLTHLAVRRSVSASTQNQAFCAILFLCREVLGIDVQGLARSVKAKRGEHLPVVLSVPETAALLEAMRGTARLMAGLIYGGGLRVSECCQLRVKDVDFAQGLLFVRDGKGGKDRSTLLAEAGREELRAHLQRSEALHHADRASAWRASGCRRRWSASTRTRAANSRGSGCFRARPCRRTRVPVSCGAITSATP
jgi:integrase